MGQWEWLGIVGGLIGVISFLASVSQAGKKDGAQLARIEAMGISTNNTLSEIKGELEQLKKEQEVSRTFRDKYTEPLKEVIKHKKDQEVINTRNEHEVKAIKEELQKLNDKFDRVMELFNSLIKEESKKLP